MVDKISLAFFETLNFKLIKLYVYCFSDPHIITDYRELDSNSKHVSENYMYYFTLYAYEIFYAQFNITSPIEKNNLFNTDCFFFCISILSF